jgi:hypothetical protein
MEDNMPYEIEFLKDHKIIRIIGRGELSIEEYRDGARRCIDEVNKKGSSKLLVDNRFIIGGPEITDIYYLPKFFYDVGLSNHIKIAILIMKNYALKDNIRFFETRCINSGYDCKIFIEKRDAINWLNTEP